MKVAIIGGGVIGCSIAYHLSRAGASVTMFEREDIGHGASGSAAGLLLEPVSDEASRALANLKRASLDLYPTFIEEVESLTGIDLEFRRTGLIRPAFTEVAAQHLRSLLHTRTQRRSGVEWVEPHVLRALAPSLNDELAGATYAPNGANLNPLSLTRALARAAILLGATVETGVCVTSVSGDPHRLTQVTASRHTWTGFDVIVIAAGAWSRQLAERISRRVPTAPIRGQMLAFRDTSLRHAVWGDDAYLVPKPNGILFAGATVEDVGFRPRTTAAGLQVVRSSAIQLMPALRHAEVVSTWAGLRPGTPDSLPILGFLGEWENVLVATGHFRDGILLAPITGKLISAAALTGELPKPLLPFAASRFELSRGVVGAAHQSGDSRQALYARARRGDSPGRCYLSAGNNRQ